MGWVISIAILFGAFVVYVIIDGVKSSRKLKALQSEFGEYTDMLEYEKGLFILYDKPNHRIYLKGKIVDSRRITKIKVKKKDGQVKLEYAVQAYSRADTGSVIGRSIAGGLWGGDVGAVIGGATADRVTEFTKTPVYTQVTRDRYIVEVYDDSDTLRAVFGSWYETTQRELEDFFRKIIDENTLAERVAHIRKKEEDHARLLAADVDSFVLGADLETVKDMLVESTPVKDYGTNAYELAKEAVALINNAWGAKFERFIVVMRRNKVWKMKGISVPYRHDWFGSLFLDLRTLSVYISRRHGMSEKNCDEVTYTMLTDDNNRIFAYSWETDSHEVYRLDYVFSDCKYRYEYTSKIVDDPFDI